MRGELTIDTSVCSIWELATAIKVSSHLPDKEQLAVEVYELGDLSRDLSDEVS